MVTNPVLAAAEEMPEHECQQYHRHSHRRDAEHARSHPRQESNQDIRGRSREGMTTAAWRTPSGRVLLSDWTDDALREWYEIHRDDPVVLGVAAQALPSGKPLVKDFEGLKNEISRVRRQGLAVVDEKFELGVVGVSAPVFDSRKSIIAAINVSAPKSRFGSRLGEAGKITIRVAAEVSQRLIAG